MNNCRKFVEGTLLLLLVIFAFGASKKQKVSGLVDKLYTHYENFLDVGRDHYGSKNTSLWMSSLQLHPEIKLIAGNRPTDIPCRVYLDRLVDAPNGSTLYWDLPDLIAASELSSLSNDSNLKTSIANYVRDFLGNNTAKNGVILWGNHYYYDAFQDTAIKFSSSKPLLVDFKSEWGDYHEERPHIPCWDLLHEIDKKAILQHVEVSSHNHFFGDQGGYNRHANQEQGHAFLESGSTLVYSLSWLYSIKKDDIFLKKADKAIRYNWDLRNLSTGLIPNSPTAERWDRDQSTTEVGFWANNMLKAAQMVPDTLRAQWEVIAAEAMRTWLQFGYDEENVRFYGSLNVSDGNPVVKKDDYPYRPGTYSDIWNPLFPTHDYPMPFAEACLKLYQISSEPVFKEACDRWVKTIEKQFSALNDSSLLYAENYARVAHYLMNYNKVFNSEEVSYLIDDIIKDSLEKLYLEDVGLFRTHTNEFRYDAVDGLGMLALVYIWYETGETVQHGEVFF